VRVAELWRYPVKSLQGERVAAAELTPAGLAGDRGWALFDLGTGLGLTARRHPVLLHAAARLRDDGGVDVVLPDGSVAADDGALSAWLGRPVQLRAADVAGPRRYEVPDDIETEAEDSWWVFEGSRDAFHDSVPLTFLSTATIGSRPVRRFRPNVLLDGGPDGGPDGGEDALVGATVRIGDAAVALTKRVARCVMVTRAQPGGIEVDRDVLRWIHRERAGMLAVGGRVLRPGTVRVGDEVAAEPQAVPVGARV
jgi:MOSC domain-containing protein